MYGLGNWADIAENVGGRTKEECEQHYRKIYIQSPEYPLPVVGGEFGTTEEFQVRKKRRLEEMQSRPLGVFLHPSSRVERDWFCSPLSG